MMSVLSAQGGKILTADKWASQNKGYLYGTDCKGNEHYELARRFLDEQKFCDDSEFDHELDCFYLENNCHIEGRGGHRFLRPSLCSKFVFRGSQNVFNDSTWLYSYHGTDSKNVQSIIKKGLLYPGCDKDVIEAHGRCHGDGVYTSKLPLYAQLYAKCKKWRGKYVQVVFSVRQTPESIRLYGSEGCHTRSMIGRNDIHKLYCGRIKGNEVQFVTKAVKDNNILQGLLVKIHDSPPDQPGGEYYQIKNLLERIVD